MRIDTVHDYILFELDKASGGYVSHEEIDRVLHLRQMDEFSSLIRMAGIDQKLHDDLAPFKKVEPYTAEDYTVVGDLKTGPTGRVIFPTDYLHFLHLRTDTKRIEVLNDNEVGDRLGSAIITATFAAREGVGGKYNEVDFTTPYLQLYPKTGIALVLTYLCKPVAPVYSYTRNGRQIVFNPVTSVNLQWNDEATNRIITRTLSSLGVHLQASDITQFMESKIQNQ